MPNIELYSDVQDDSIIYAEFTVPGEYAQGVCDQLIGCGIKAIWNFAPTHLDVPANILVQNENMATSLAVLSMHLQAQMKEKKWYDPVDAKTDFSRNHGGFVRQTL